MSKKANGPDLFAIGPGKHEPCEKCIGTKWFFLNVQNDLRQVPSQKQKPLTGELPIFFQLHYMKSFYPITF